MEKEESIIVDETQEDIEETVVSESGEETGEVTAEEKKPLYRRIIRFGLELAIYIIIILVGAVSIPKYIVQRTLVDGESMENNLMDDDNILVEKITPHFKTLSRFDVIVFYPHYDKDKSETSFLYDLKLTCMNILHMDTTKVIESENDESLKYYREYYVKRIIGLPGETVQIVEGDIYIDGGLLKEDYGKMPITNPGIAEEPVKLGADEYFVLGDNRKVSLDSRYEEVGPVQKEEIAGKAILRIWPFDSFGKIK